MADPRARELGVSSELEIVGCRPLEREQQPIASRQSARAVADPSLEFRAALPPDIFCECEVARELALGADARCIWCEVDPHLESPARTPHPRYLGHTSVAHHALRDRIDVAACHAASVRAVIHRLSGDERRIGDIAYSQLSSINDLVSPAELNRALHCRRDLGMGRINLILELTYSHARKN